MSHRQQPQTNINACRAGPVRVILSPWRRAHPRRAASRPSTPVQKRRCLRPMKEMPMRADWGAALAAALAAVILTITALRADPLSALVQHAGWCLQGGSGGSGVAVFAGHCGLCWAAAAMAGLAGALLARAVQQSAPRPA